MYNERKIMGIQGLSRTENISNNIISIDKVPAGLLVCADMWHSDLVKEMAKKKIKIIICPAMTKVAKGFQNYAKTLWHSLVVTRAREFVLPIIVVDNPLVEKKGNNRKCYICC